MVMHNGDTVCMRHCGHDCEWDCDGCHNYGHCGFTAKRKGYRRGYGPSHNNHDYG